MVTTQRRWLWKSLWICQRWGGLFWMENSLFWREKLPIALVLLSEQGSRTERLAVSLQKYPNS